MLPYSTTKEKTILGRERKVAISVGGDGCEDPTSELHAYVKVKDIKNIGGFFNGRLVGLENQVTECGMRRI
jgi:hypothetical protein